MPKGESLAEQNQLQLDYGLSHLHHHMREMKKKTTTIEVYIDIYNIARMMKMMMSSRTGFCFSVRSTELSRYFFFFFWSEPGTALQKKGKKILRREA
jgi:hypothetical protein